MAPIWLRKWLIKKIERETEFARNGRPASIVAKMNSLCDKEVIDALYEASQAGVRIQLIIRGICCLRAGVPGLSDNISVHSIVGRYLEHARIMRFENGGDVLYYMGSADWMPRNLDRRVEIVFPLLSEDNKARAQHILDVQLADNLKAHIMMPDGTYDKADLRGKKKICAQETFMNEAADRESRYIKDNSTEGKRVFIPMEAGE